MPCDHVLPILILRIGTGTRADRNGCCGFLCAVYILDRLVRLPNVKAKNKKLIQTLGNSVSVILSFETYVTLAKCSTMAGDGPGISQQSCSSLTIPSFKYALAKLYNRQTPSDNSRASTF